MYAVSFQYLSLLSPHSSYSFATAVVLMIQPCNQARHPSYNLQIHATLIKILQF